MKGLTIRVKMTLWFILVMTVVLSLSYAAFYVSSKTVAHSNLQTELREIVDNDISEIAYDPEGKTLEAAAGYRQIPYGEGFLVIRERFLDFRNGIGIGIYAPDGQLVYGENLIRGEEKSVEFNDRSMLNIKSGPDTFYVYDRKVNAGQGGELWLRGAVDREQRHEELLDLFRFSLLLLPFLVLFAAACGYFITKRSLQPIQRLILAAESISSGSDLKQRIDAGNGENEVQQLTRSFNGMMQRLDEAFESEKQFTSDVSHELRTPVTTILAQCEFALEEEELQEEEARSALQVIARQGGRMQELIEDMLTYTRIDRNQEKYLFEKVDLSSLTAEICEDFAPAVHIDTDLAEDVFVQGSDLLLCRLEMNLLENAVRYTGEDGQVSVSLFRDGRDCVLTVTDNGIGIAPDQQERIFDRFYQADPARTGEGTGLGLAMVKEIAQVHGGSVSVESEPGRGSSFTVRLPQMPS